MARTLIVFPDAHGIARGKVANEPFRPSLQIGCASGVFSKDIFGVPQIFDVLATPSGAADITIRPEDGEACTFEPAPGLLFGTSSIAIGTVTDPKHRPHPLDFRRMLRDKLRRVSDLNRYRFGAELEFHLMPPDDSPALRADGQAYAFGSASNLAICIDAMMNALDRVGIPWNNFSQENHFNQFEFSLQHSTPLEQADRVFLTRFVLRDVAALHGLRCTFTPVVREDGAPSNLHLHVSDPATDCVEALSAGLASVLSGPFLAICPTRNGRLVQRMNSFSSKKIDVGEGDRFKALRIVGGTDERHIELRTPTSDANPYLAILMILGGLQAGDDNPANGADIASNHGIEWDFDRSIEAFQTDPIARRMLDSESIELFTSMKRLEGRKSAELGFEAEVSMLMAVI